MIDDKPENKTQHLHILMAPSEVVAIDDWGFKNRIRTRGEAIRRLCHLALSFDQDRQQLTRSLEISKIALGDAMRAAFAIEDEIVAENLRSSNTQISALYNNLFAALWSVTNNIEGLDLLTKYADTSAKHADPNLAEAKSELDIELHALRDRMNRIFESISVDENLPISGAEILPTKNILDASRKDEDGKD